MDREPGLRPRLFGGDTFLRSGFAYLVRSEVRMPELYPILGELLFSDVGYADPKKYAVARGGPSKLASNAVGVFVDDEPRTMLRNLHDPALYDDNRPYKAFIGVDRKRGLPLPSYAAWMHTFGNFGGKHHAVQPTQRDYEWVEDDLVGPGNPMEILRFLKMQLREVSKPDREELSVFLLTSLTNCYRNLGLGDTSALLKVVCESIWVGDPDAGDIRYGMLLAVVQADVLTAEEEKYLEASFFDGIIHVRPVVHRNVRFTEVDVEVLPRASRAVPPVYCLPVWLAEMDPPVDVASTPPCTCRYVRTYEIGDEVRAAREEQSQKRTASTASPST